MPTVADPRCRRVYTSREASHLSGLTPRRLGQWTRRGYIPSGLDGGRRVFSYRDIAEAMAVRKLLEAGFGTGAMKEAVGLLSAVEEELSKGGWAYVELGDLEHISVDPECMSGTPTIRGTRIEAMFVGKEAHSEQGQRILEGYRLTPQQIEDAARWRDKALSYVAA